MPSIAELKELFHQKHAESLARKGESPELPPALAQGLEAQGQGQQPQAPITYSHETAPATPALAGLQQFGAGLKSAAVEADADKLILGLNERFFRAKVGGRNLVFEESIDPVLKTPKLEESTQRDLKEELTGQFARITNENGDSKTIPLADLWLTSPLCRKYKGICFDPSYVGHDRGYYNTYTGLNVPPCEGDVKPFLTYLEQIICDGNKVAYNYLIRWLALLIQQPWRRAGVAVVLKGEKGTGKSFLGEAICHIFGHHAQHIIDSGNLTSNFNEFLEDCVFLFSDESHFSGDRKEADKLKGMITSPTMKIERKFHKRKTTANPVTYMFASNNSEPVQVTGDERRFLILKVSNKKMRDSEYFGGLQQYLNDGGYEAIVDFLLKVDIKGFKAQDVPRTSELTEQVVSTLNPVDRWLFDRLYESVGWVEELDAQEVIYSIRQSIGNDKYALKEATPEKIGHALKKAFGDKTNKKRVRKGSKLAYNRTFPPLAEARLLFAQNVLRDVSYTWDLLDIIDEEPEPDVSGVDLKQVYRQLNLPTYKDDDGSEWSTGL